MPEKQVNCRFGAVFAAALVLCCEVHAQRALVITSSLSATRQSARLYAQTVDLADGTAPDGGTALAGSSLLFPPLTEGEGPLSFPAGTAAVSTGPSEPPLHPDQGYPETVVSLVQFRAPDVTAQCLYQSETGWREWAAAVVPGSVTPGLLVLGKYVSGAGDGAAVGRARLTGGTGSVPGPSAEWSLPGVPVAGIWSASAQAALVLCSGRAGAAPMVVKCAPGVPAAVRRSADTLAGWNPACTDARTLSVLPGTGLFAVAFSGRVLGSGSTEPQTQVYLFDAEELAPLAGPVAVRGMADRMHPAGGDGLWVASRAPGTDFAYATRLHIDAVPPGAAAAAEYPLTGALDGFLLAAHPVTGTVAAALGRPAGNLARRGAR